MVLRIYLVITSITLFSSTKMKKVFILLDGKIYLTLIFKNNELMNYFELAFLSSFSIIFIVVIIIIVVVIVVIFFFVFVIFVILIIFWIAVIVVAIVQDIIVKYINFKNRSCIYGLSLPIVATNWLYFLDVFLRSMGSCSHEVKLLLTDLDWFLENRPFYNFMTATHAVLSCFGWSC